MDPHCLDPLGKVIQSKFHWGWMKMHWTRQQECYHQRVHRLDRQQLMNQLLYCYQLLHHWILNKFIKYENDIKLVVTLSQGKGRRSIFSQQCHCWMPPMATWSKYNQNGLDHNLPIANSHPLEKQQQQNWKHFGFGFVN